MVTRKVSGHLPSRFRVVDRLTQIGTGFHGDFITGWEEDFLQQVVDTCTDSSGMIEKCSLFDIKPEGYQNTEKCEIELPEELAKEDVKGPMDALTGGQGGHGSSASGDEKPKDDSKPEDNKDNTDGKPKDDSKPEDNKDNNDEKPEENSKAEDNKDINNDGKPKDDSEPEENNNNDGGNDNNDSQPNNDPKPSDGPKPSENQAGVGAVFAAKETNAPDGPVVPYVVPENNAPAPTPPPAGAPAAPAETPFSTERRTVGNVVNEILWVAKEETVTASSTMVVSVPGHRHKHKRHAHKPHARSFHY